MVQEEIRQSTRDENSSTDKEENFSLVIKGKKSKGNKSQGEEDKREFSNIKCFHFHEYGHYATKFPQKTRKKEPAVAVVSEALASQFEIDFTLIACMANTVMGCMQYLDSGVSFHMMGNRDLFSDLEEKDLQQNIEFGDDGRYRATNICTVTFQRESGSPLRLADVLYVPGLRKKLCLHSSIGRPWLCSDV